MCSPPLSGPGRIDQGAAALGIAGTGLLAGYLANAGSPSSVAALATLVAWAAGAGTWWLGSRLARRPAAIERASSIAPARDGGSVAVDLSGQARSLGAVPLWPWLVSWA